MDSKRQQLEEAPVWDNCGFPVEYNDERVKAVNSNFTASVA